MITLILPLIHGDVDFGEYSSGGIRVYMGKLTIDQINKETQEPAYAGRAVEETYNADGTLASVRVTFTNDAADKPIAIDDVVAGKRSVGADYTSELHAVGDLSYLAYYSKLDVAG